MFKDKELLLFTESTTMAMKFKLLMKFKSLTVMIFGILKDGIKKRLTSEILMLFGPMTPAYTDY